LQQIIRKSALVGEDAPQALELFYTEYAPSRFPAAKTKRAQQSLAKKLRMPLIRAGNSVLIDPVAGDARLRELALHQQQEPPRRGRPRLIAR
jgi:hypothetical protein